jgi:hypothetical protein
MNLQTSLDPVPEDGGYQYNLGERRILLELVQNLINRLTLLSHKLADQRYEDPLSGPEWQYLIDTACRLLYRRSAYWIH